LSQQRDFRVLSHHDSTSLDPKKGRGQHGAIRLGSGLNQDLLGF
jgi:hypothetical protein